MVLYNNQLLQAHICSFLDAFVVFWVTWTCQMLKVQAHLEHE